MAFLVMVAGAAINDRLAVSSTDHQTIWSAIWVSGTILLTAGMAGGVYLDARRLAQAGVEVRGAGPGSWAVLTALAAIVVIPIYLTTRSEAVANATTPPGQTPTKPTGGVALGGIALVVGAVMIAMIGAAVAGHNSTTAPSSTTRSSGLSIAKYNSLYTGMRLSEVQAILGSPGVRQSSFATGSMSIETYRWDSVGASIVVQFDRDRLMTKAQQGL